MVQRSETLERILDIFQVTGDELWLLHNNFIKNRLRIISPDTECTFKLTTSSRMLLTRSKLFFKFIPTR